jgi:hypothetical protein
MTKQDQIKELAAVIRKDYPEVNAEHIATLAVEWFNKDTFYFPAATTGKVTIEGYIDPHGKPAYFEDPIYIRIHSCDDKLTVKDE